MSVQRNPSGSVERVLADHDILAQYIDNFNDLFAKDTAAHHRQAADTVKSIINHWLVAHFAYEEQRLFPALLAELPGAEVSEHIASLKAEHQSLLQEAKRLNQLLDQPERRGGKRAVLRKTMLDFVNRLQQHSASEDKLFPSLV